MVADAGRKGAELLTGGSVADEAAQFGGFF
jgi:hypothetical protein